MRSPTEAPSKSSLPKVRSSAVSDVPLLASDSYAGAGLTGVAALATVPVGEVGAFGAAGLASTFVASSGLYAAVPLLGTAGIMYSGGQAVFSAVYEYNNPLTSNNHRNLQAIAELDTANNDPIEGYNILRRHLEEHGLIGDLKSIDLKSKFHEPFTSQVNALFEIGQGSRDAGFEALENTLEAVTTPTLEEKIQEYLEDQQPAIRALVNLGNGNLAAGLMLTQQFISKNGNNIQNIDVNADNFDPRFKEIFTALHNLGSQVFGARPKGREIECGLEDITREILNDMAKEREEEARLEKENNKDEDEEDKDKKRERKREEKQQRRKLNDNTDNTAWAWIATAAFEAAASVVGTHSLRKKNRRTAAGASHVISAYMEEEVATIIEYFEVADQMMILADAANDALKKNSVLFNEAEGDLLSKLKSAIEGSSPNHPAFSIINQINELGEGSERASFNNVITKVIESQNNHYQDDGRKCIIRDSVKSQPNQDSATDNQSPRDKIIEDLLPIITKKQTQNPNRYSTILHKFLSEETVEQVLNTPVVNDGVHTTEGAINIGRRVVTGLVGGVSTALETVGALGKNNPVRLFANQVSHKDEFSEKFAKVADEKSSIKETARRLWTGYDPDIVAGDIRAAIGKINTKILEKALEKIITKSPVGNSSQCEDVITSGAPTNKTSGAEKELKRKKLENLFRNRDRGVLENIGLQTQEGVAVIEQGDKTNSSAPTIIPSLDGDDSKSSDGDDSKSSDGAGNSFLKSVSSVSDSEILEILDFQSVSSVSGELVEGDSSGTVDSKKAENQPPSQDVNGPNAYPLTKRFNLDGPSKL